MKIVMSLLILLTTTPVFASNVSFSCKMKNGNATIGGTASNDKISVQIVDEENALDISDYSGDQVHTFERVVRKKEATYAFAKYYNDNHPTLGLSLSIPKDLLALGSDQFSAFLTVYSDDGDVMVPSDAVTFICKMYDR